MSATDNLPSHEANADAEAEPGDIAPGTTARVAPLKAVRLYCLGCCSGSAHEVAQCVSLKCPLSMYRFGRRPAREDVAHVAGLSTHPAEQPMSGGELYEHTALRAIRRRCLDCSGASVKAVTTCNFGLDQPSSPCPLHPHRLRTGSKRRTGAELDLERERLRQRLQSDKQMQTEPDSAE